MPPAERVVAFVFSHDVFRARPPAPFYRLAGPATWDACSIDRKHEDYRDKCPKSEGPARLRSGGAGSGFPFARRGFFRSDVDCCPYKPHVGAFVGEDVSDMFDIAYRDMFDTVRSVREICDIGIAPGAMPDMQNDDRFVGDRVIDAVRIAGWRQDADVGVARPHAKPGIMAQTLHALAEVIADAVGGHGARFGHEMLANGRKVIPGLNVKPKL